MQDNFVSITTTLVLVEQSPKAVQHANIVTLDYIYHERETETPGQSYVILYSSALHKLRQT